MSECSPIESCLSASTRQRRERLAARLVQSGCRVNIRNSMQELLAIMYLGKLGREARAEVLGTLADPAAKSDAVSALPGEPQAAGQSSADRVGATLPREAAREAPDPAPVKASLFEQSLQTTGRVISEQT